MVDPSRGDFRTLLPSCLTPPLLVTEEHTPLSHTPSHHVLPHRRLKSNGVNGPYPETSEAVIRNASFPLVSHLSQVSCHSNGKLTNTDPPSVSFCGLGRTKDVLRSTGQNQPSKTTSQWAGVTWPLLNHAGHPRENVNSSSRVYIFPHLKKKEYKSCSPIKRKRAHNTPRTLVFSTSSYLEADSGSLIYTFIHQIVTKQHLPPVSHQEANTQESVSSALKEVPVGGEGGG
jgi:hypothetical protein